MGKSSEMIRHNKEPMMKTPFTTSGRCRPLWGLLVVGVVIGLPSGTAAQTAAPPKPGRAADAEPPDANPRYETRKEHDPNGTGTFYLGREIAQVMSWHGAPWLERDTRQREEDLTALVKALDLKPGMVVADIGAGTGVVSALMARPIAPDGVVLAVDIQEEMLHLLKRKMKRLKIDNVKPVLGTITSPELDPASVDLAIMVDVYHEFSHPYEMMLALSKTIKPGGRVVFVEYRREDPNVPIKLVHKMTEAQVKKEIGHPEFGLKWTETIDVLPRQHIIVFEKTPAGSE